MDQCASPMVTRGRGTEDKGAGNGKNGMGKKGFSVGMGIWQGVAMYSPSIPDPSTPCRQATPEMALQPLPVAVFYKAG
jgi:hypothetical protein